MTHHAIIPFENRCTACGFLSKAQNNSLCLVCKDDAAEHAQRITRAIHRWEETFKVAFHRTDKAPLSNKPEYFTDVLNYPIKWGQPKMNNEVSDALKKVIAARLSGELTSDQLMSSVHNNECEGSIDCDLTKLENEIDRELDARLSQNTYEAASAKLITLLKEFDLE